MAIWRRSCIHGIQYAAFHAAEDPASALQHKLLDTVEKSVANPWSPAQCARAETLVRALEEFVAAPSDEVSAASISPPTSLRWALDCSGFAHKVGDGSMLEHVRNANPWSAHPRQSWRR